MQACIARGVDAKYDQHGLVAMRASKPPLVAAWTPLVVGAAAVLAALVLGFILGGGAWGRPVCVSHAPPKDVGGASESPARPAQTVHVQLM